MTYRIIAEVAVNNWYEIGDDGYIESYIDDGGADNDNVTGYIILDDSNDTIDDGFDDLEEAEKALEKLNADSKGGK